MMNILILEDEIFAAEKLKKLIHNQADLENTSLNMDWVQTVEDGKSALLANEYDLIFSDIELLDGRVFRLYDEVSIITPIIFCTSYDQFYLEAFATNGIAYLLKPYSAEDFLNAWNKYNSLFQSKTKNTLNKDLIQALMTLTPSSQRNFKTSLIAKKKHESYILKTKDLILFSANGEYVKAISSQNQLHIIHQTFGELIDTLNPSLFFQINRSECINKAFIQSFEPYIKNRIAIKLMGLQEPLYTSNSKAALFKKWIEIG